jgi:hypothetical protein
MQASKPLIAYGLDYVKFQTMVRTSDNPGDGRLK